MRKKIAVLAAAAVGFCGLSGCSEEYPETEIPDFTIPEQILDHAQAEIPEIDVDGYAVPDTEALNFVQDLKLGWNLGNTFDAFDCNLTDEMAYEKAWCGAYTTIEDIAAVKAAGFRTVRIPVSWHNHVDENFQVSKAWMQRIKEVVDWCIACDLYVIVNTHHDNAEAYYYPDSAHLESSKAFLSAIWTQMGEVFRDYDERVILESMNEPRLVGTNYEWVLDESAPECQDAMECINRLNQLFVDTIRGIGGGNETRYLLCPGYAASVDGAAAEEFRIPDDPADHVIVSVHAYTPYDFALNRAGTDSFDSSNPVDRNAVLNFMDILYGKFVMNGTPVLLGEFGALNKDNLEDRIDFSAYYVAAARGRGMTCCWWDNNAFMGSGENFGLLFRKTATYTYPDIVKAMLAYCETGEAS